MLKSEDPYASPTSFEPLIAESLSVHFGGKEPKHGWPKKWEELTVDEKLDYLKQEIDSKVSHMDLSERP